MKAFAFIIIETEFKDKNVLAHPFCRRMTSPIRFYAHLGHESYI